MTPSTRRLGRPIDPRLEERRQKQIADAAYTEFSSRGFDATTIPMVARHAAVGRGTIYRFFGSKEQIFGWYAERYKSSERPTISFMISVVPP